MADTGLIWAEDEALRKWLTGLTLTAPNRTGGKVTVETRFGYPTQEAIRSYPLIVIDLLDVVPVWEETHSAQRFTPTYWPDEVANLEPSDEAHTLRTTEFMPVRLMYQVSTYSRNALHDRALTNLLLVAMPFRWGELYIPADDTLRRMELLDYQPSPFIDADSKRTFRSVFTIQVAAEIAPFQYQEYVRTQTVTVDVRPTDHL